ncbi:MAG: tetratricopeptide (TPR) repeat protein [Kiritimatiellia bacterium]
MSLPTNPILWLANAALYMILTTLMVSQWEMIQWAHGESNKYRDERISSPIERYWYRDAKEYLEAGEPEKALPLLVRSVNVDPTSKAVFYLAETLSELHQYSQALARYEQYILLNPKFTDSYYRASEVHQKLGQSPAARDVLLRGRDFLQTIIPQNVPQIDRSVRTRFNNKALQVYQQMKVDLAMFEAKLLKLKPQRHVVPNS